MERERKFLVKQSPDDLKRQRRKAIRQGYLAIPNGKESKPVQVRVRDENGRYFLTVKGGSGASREEVELRISKKQFASLWPLTKGKRLSKVRWEIPMGKLKAELDVYGGRLRGLKTAEVEFQTDGQLRAFRPAEWMGREITDRDEYGNSALATAGKPREGRGR